MTVTTMNVSTDEYRRSTKLFYEALQKEDTTLEQAENGFKCLSIMYMGLSFDEFENDALQKIKDAENAQILTLAHKWYFEWEFNNQ